MPQDVGYQRVQDLLDKDLEVIDRIEQHRTDEVEYHFAVHHEEESVHVVKRAPERPLTLITRKDFPNDALEVIHGPRRRYFLEKLGAVLSNASATRMYVDAKGKPVSYDEFVAVQMKRWIYPSGLDQHTLMTAIIDMINARIYIHEVTSTMLLETRSQQ